MEEKNIKKLFWKYFESFLSPIPISISTRSMVVVIVIDEKAKFYLLQGTT